MSRNIEEIKAKINRIRKDSKTSRLVKFSAKMQKNEIKYKNKEIKDLQTINELLKDIDFNDNIYIFTNAFDSPNLLLYFAKHFKIESLYISTWAITDKGLSVINRLNKEGIEINLLLDTTYSYKWIFQSGAHEYLENVNFKFTENHSKMILIKTDKFYISILGSMNLSNNPRFENINIIENENVYNFYKEQLNIFHDEKISREHFTGNLFESSGINTKID